MTSLEDAALAPLPYHFEIRDYLKRAEPDLWQWFQTARSRENYAEELRLSLLKTTYRLSPDSHPELYQQVGAAADALNLSLSLKVYQAQNAAGQLNASIYFLPDEAHIVLSGPLLSLLSPAEMTAVFGHELAHHALWKRDQGDFLLADRLFDAVTNDGNASAVFHESARRYRLHTEIFADRGALRATGDLGVVVAALVKIQTGLAQVSAESYLAQAAEIFSGGPVSTEELSHPECFIRAHALAIWAAQGSEAEPTIRTIITGLPSLAGLDLTGQQDLTALTRRFLQELLRPRWWQTEPALAHARQFFPDFSVASSTPPADEPELLDALRKTGVLLTDYFAYVLLDFARVDPDLEDVPVAAVLQWSEKLGISDQVENLLVKELGLKARDLAKLKPRVAELLAQAEASA